MTDFIKYSINSKWWVNITAKRCKSSVLGRAAFSEGEEENAGELGRPFRDAPFASVRGQGGKVFSFFASTYGRRSCRTHDGSWHLAPGGVRHPHHPPSRPTFTEVPGKDEFSEVRIAPVRHPRPSLTAGCNEVDPSGLLLGVPRLRGTVIFRVGLLKKHLCVREVSWSNITAKR